MLRAQNSSMEQIQLSPMLAAKAVGSLPESAEWIYQPKMDGFRAIGQVVMREEAGAAAVNLRGRGGGDFTHKYPGVVEQLPLAFKGLKRNTRTVVDGEIVATVNRSLQSLSELQRKTSARTAIYYVFDILVLNGDLVISRPLEERLDLLRKHFKVQPRIKLIESYSWRDLPALRKAINQMNWEGIVAKRLGSAYTPGRRSQNWQKEKRPEYRRAS